MNKTNKTNEMNRLINISVSNKNYLELKKLGLAGDSFNDVITELLRKVSQPDSRIPSRNQIGTTDN